MTLLLSIHPAAQLTVIIIGFYAAYLGYRRIQSLHLDITAKFPRKRHAVSGAIALISMIMGSAAGSLIKGRYLQHTHLGTHEAVAMIIIALGIFGILSGYYLYASPRKRKIIPLIHGIGNFAVLLLAIVQIITGTAAYLRYVLHW